MPYVYLLRCAGGSFYAGWTMDLAARLAAHQAGRGSRYTRSRLPVTLAYSEELPTESAARRRELRSSGSPTRPRSGCAGRRQPQTAIREGPRAPVIERSRYSAAGEATGGRRRGMTDDTLERTRELESLARSLGADLVGVADLGPLGGMSTQPAALLAPFTFGVSIAVRLSDAVVDAITPTDPTAVYAQPLRHGQRPAGSDHLSPGGAHPAPRPPGPAHPRQPADGVQALVRRHLPQGHCPRRRPGLDRPEPAADHAGVRTPGAPGLAAHRHAPGQQRPASPGLRRLSRLPGCLPRPCHHRFRVAATTRRAGSWR